MLYAGSGGYYIADVRSMMRWSKRDSVLRCLWLLPVIFITGCASMHAMVCNLVEPDSYILVSIVRCQTMHASFDYNSDTDFSVLESYAWMPAEHSLAERPLSPHDGQLNEWLTPYIDARLTQKGFRLDHTAPDFLVNYDVPVKMRGTLTLTFLHADSQQLIWRGTVDDEAYPARNPDAWETRIRTAVDMLLDQFPPIRPVSAGDAAP
jgi:Domain of unknown function (DUF4136)